MPWQPVQAPDDIDERPDSRVRRVEPHSLQAAGCEARGCLTGFDAADLSGQARAGVDVEAEDRAKPLSDEAIATKLGEQGIEIARRTVVKYRQQLDIPAARHRREY